MLELYAIREAWLSFHMASPKALRKIKPSLKKVARFFLQLVHKQGIWQSKHIFYHVWIIVAVGGSGFVLLSGKDRIPAIVTFAYVVLSVAAYWLNELLFIRRGALDRRWLQHVIDPRRNRISVAVCIRVQELGYVLLMFFGWFLFAGNIIYKTAGSDSWRQWARSVLHVVHSAGIQTNRDFHAGGWLGVTLTSLSSMAGLIFAGVWVAIFMSDFAIIFGKDSDERKRRLRLVSRRHRTSRLRRTRRSLQ